MKKLMYLVVLPLLVACSQESDFVENFASEKDASTKVSLADAVRVAEEAISSLDASKNTRSVSRRVSSIDILKGSKNTRSNCGVDTLLYIVNFDDDKGFAVVSADTRLVPCYALSDEGQLTLEDIRTQDNLNFYFEQLQELIEGDLASPNIIIPDSIERRPDADGIISPSEFAGWKYLSSGILVANKLASFQTKYSQGDPYNYYCPTIEGYSNKKAQAGCSAIATYTYMSYHEWPETFLDKTVDWLRMNTETGYRQTWWMIRQLGNEDLLNIRYFTSPEESYRGGETIDGCEKSLPRTFRKMGYHAPNPVNFTILQANSILKNNIALAYGNAKTGDTNDSTIGHCWVLDGTYFRDLQTYIKDKGVVTDRLYYYHSVWGWSGKSNGYFYYGSDQFYVRQVDIDHPIYDNPSGDRGNEQKFENLRIFYAEPLRN